MLIVFSVCAFSVFERGKERRSKMLVHVTSRAVQCCLGHNNQKNLENLEFGVELVMSDRWKLFIFKSLEKKNYLGTI